MSIIIQILTLVFVLLSSIWYDDIIPCVIFNYFLINSIIIYINITKINELRTKTNSLKEKINELENT